MVPQVAINPTQGRYRVRQHALALTLERGARQVQHARAEVADAVGEAEHRIELGVDRREVARHRGDVGHDFAHLLVVEVLQVAHHMLRALVRREEHITVLTIDAQRQHIVATAQLRIDALSHHAVLVGVGLGGLLGDRRRVGARQTHGHQLILDLLLQRRVVAVWIDRQPKVRVRRRQRQPIDRCADTVLLGPGDRTLPLHGDVGEDIHHVTLAALRTLAGAAAHVEPLACAHAEVHGAEVVVVGLHVTHQRHIVAVGRTPFVDGLL